MLSPGSGAQLLRCTAPAPLVLGVSLMYSMKRDRRAQPEGWRRVDAEVPVSQTLALCWDVPRLHAGMSLSAEASGGMAVGQWVLLEMNQ